MDGSTEILPMRALASGCLPLSEARKGQCTDCNSLGQ